MLTSFCFSPGGLDTLIRDLTVEDRGFISQQLNDEDPEGKLDQFTYYTLLTRDDLQRRFHGFVFFFFCLSLFYL